MGFLPVRLPPSSDKHPANVTDDIFTEHFTPESKKKGVALFVSKYQKKYRKKPEGKLAVQRWNRSKASKETQKRRLEKVKGQADQAAPLLALQ